MYELPADIEWAVSGSTALAIRGIELEPNDIDIQSNAKDVYRIEKLLNQFSYQKVSYVISENIKSHYGKLKINDTKIDLMGDVQKKLDDGSWEEKIDLSSIIEFISFRNMEIPVLELEHEYHFYQLIEKPLRANQIKNLMENKNNI